MGPSAGLGGQLAGDGRIVVPLRMRGLTRSLALERDGDRMVSRSAMICGFVRIQGAGAHQERLLLLRGEEIKLRFDDGGAGRSPPTERTVEFGAHAFGPHAPAAAEAMAEQVRVWDRDQRGGCGPNFAVSPTGTPDKSLFEGLVIGKRHSRITISWPAVASAVTGQDVQQHPVE